MRLDHLLSKENGRSRGCIAVQLSRDSMLTWVSMPTQVSMPTKVGTNISGGDACRGDTRTHPEHDG